MDVVWLELLVVGTLIWLGYMGARLIARFHLPAVTGFLLVGVLLGPHGLKLLTSDLLHKIVFAEPLALGLIVFLIGAELTRKMLARHHWSFWLTSALNITLPALGVALAVRAIAPGDQVAVWLLAIIAISGAPATVMAVISEMQASGRSCDTLLGTSALDNVLTVVLYSAAVPFLMLSMDLHDSIGGALMQTAKQVGGAMLLGVLAGIVLAWLLERVFRDGELLALGLTNVLLVVAAAEAIGVSSLLAPLVAGVTVATIEERRGSRERIFRSLKTVEYPVYIIFFTLAGAHLDLAAIVAAGLLALAYIAARSAGKFVAGFAGALAGGFDARRSAWLGLGMLPQAGVAVGLALNAAQIFPEAGSTVNAVVLAAIVVFEIIGPVLTKRAVACTMESRSGDEGDTDAMSCGERVVLMPVSGALTLDRLLNTLAVAVPEGSCSATIVLCHVVTAGRAYDSARSLESAERLLERLADGVRGLGFDVETTLITSPTLERGIARVAEQVGADLVAMGAPLRSHPLAAISPLRSMQHRVLDALDVPVLVVPMAENADLRSDDQTP